MIYQGKPHKDEILETELSFPPEDNRPLLCMEQLKRCVLQFVPYRLFIFALLAGFFLTSCNPDRPNFEPSYSGAPPEENLDQYLDTKAVFAGLEQVKGVRNQLDSLLTLTDKLKNYDDDIALVYADTAYSMATEKNWQLSRGIASYYIALLKGRREKYGEGIEDALVDADHSKQIFENLQQFDWIVRINSLIGIFYERKKNWGKAIEHLNEAKAIIDDGLISKSDSLIELGELLHTFANIYKSKDTVQANFFFEESYQIYQSTDNEAALARLKYDWAQMFYKKERFAEAEELIQSGLKYAVTFQDIRATFIGYQKLGIAKYRQYRTYGNPSFFTESMQSYLKCFEYQKEDRYFLYDQIGQLFQQKAYKSDSEELVYVYVDSALVAYRNALEEARKEGVLSEMKRMGSNISRLCNWRFRKLGKDCSDLLETNSGNFLNSNYAGLTDTIGNILQLANRRNRANERREIEVKNKQSSRIQWLISGASLMLAILIFIVLLQGQQQKRLKAKMEALRAQINPHFISNSLNAIESLVNLDKKEAAAKYLIHFSRLSRRILNSSRDGNSSLAEELQTLEHFLALEQLRFRDKLQYLVDVGEDINPKQVVMPAMILQPYVENAIWHGIKPKAGKGLVKIQIEREGKYLICVIKDNGVGRTKSAEIKSASVLQQKSVAMKINQERLNVVGRAKGAKVEVVDLYDEQGQASGTKVIIRLPYKEMSSK